MRKNYDYIVPGYHFPNSEITAIGTVWRERDNTARAQLRAYVKCRCSCGNEFIGRIDRLTTNDPEKSPHTCRCEKCGRGRKKIKPTNWEYKATSTIDKVQLKTNFIGNIFGGHWYCEAYTSGDKFGHSYFICINEENGSTCIFSNDQLKKMGTTEELYNPNCGREYTLEDESGSIMESSGEVATGKWLETHNIAFEREYSFKDLIGDGGKLRFDFKIKDKPIVIEFQGVQHYMSVEHFGGESQFKKQIRYDNIKRAYCKKHGIKLIEIPYNYINMDDYLSNI